MRIPFLNKRKRIPSLFQKGIEDEFALNRKAQQYIVTLFMGVKTDAEMQLTFIFEQLYVVYNLALFSGSHETSDCARKALQKLRSEFEGLNATAPYIMDAMASVACSKALQMGIPILQELPRSEFKLAYVQARKLTESGNILTYLENLR
jgi:hypothetical protein